MVAFSTGLIILGFFFLLYLFIYLLFSYSYSVYILPFFPPLFYCLLFLSLAHADISEMQVLLHETPAVALIEGRYGGTKTAGGRACPLSLQLSTGLTFGNCKLQKLARAKCLTLFDLQPYGAGRKGR